MSKLPIRTLFLDIGGVILSNGWQQDARELAAKHFKLDFEEFNQRHKLCFETFEIGKLTLDEYLDLVIFDRKRQFSRDEFREFMMNQSTQSPAQFKFFKQLLELKEKHGFKVIAVSNEARELNDYRIETFELDHLIDFFVSSCYIHTRKPDAKIFKFAIDASQTPPAQIAYIDDQGLFTGIASGLGVHGLHHIDEADTLKNLAALGLR